MIAAVLFLGLPVAWLARRAAARSLTAAALVVLVAMSLAQMVFMLVVHQGQLLVAQIKNQNPLNPADGVEFLSQLAQFTQLEQTIGIHDEVAGLRQDFKDALAEPQAAAA